MTFAYFPDGLSLARSVPGRRPWRSWEAWRIQDVFERYLGSTRHGSIPGETSYAVESCEMA